MGIRVYDYLVVPLHYVGNIPFQESDVGMPIDFCPVGFVKIYSPDHLIGIRVNGHTFGIGVICYQNMFPGFV